MTKKPETQSAEDQQTFTKEDVQKIVEGERRNQFLADETRIHGNAFFAESLDHIGTLAARDPFWKKVYQYGTMFKRQFDVNTGQAEIAPQPQKTAPSPAPKEKPAAESKAPDTGSSAYDESAE